MFERTPTLGPQPEVDGLLALMLLVDARSAARVDHGRLVPLDEQDRTRWDAAEIDEGHRLVRGCLALNRPGPYQVQAAINAVHTDALDASMTDWSQIVRLYDTLLALAASPVVALNRAVAVAEVDGVEVALRSSSRCSSRRTTPGTRRGPTCSAGWSGGTRRGRRTTVPIELAGSDEEREFLRQRRDRLPG